MQAKRRPLRLLSAMRTSSTGRPIRAPSRPRPDLRLIESSPVSTSQRSMRTLRLESTSIPSRSPRMVTFLITTPLQ